MVTNESTLATAPSQTRSRITEYLDGAQADPNFNRNLFMGFSISMLGAGFMLGLRRGIRKKTKARQTPMTIQQQQRQKQLSHSHTDTTRLGHNNTSDLKRTKPIPILLHIPAHLEGGLMQEHTKALKEAAVSKGEKDYRSAASALAIATVLSVGSFSALVYGSCRALGVDNAREFRAAMQKLLGVEARPTTSEAAAEVPVQDTNVTL